MTVEESQDNVDDSANDRTSSRRDALKKAAAAGAVSAAVWAAPRVDGLSIAPDYASAGTNTTGVITFRLDGNGPGLLGANNWMNAGGSTAGVVVVQNGPSDNQAIILSTPLGPAGNAVYTFPSGLDTDGPAVTGGTVVFNIDPPYNKCQIVGSNTGWDGSTGGLPTLGNNWSGTPIPNGSSPFSQTVSMPGGGGPYYNPATKINFIEVRIQCS
jgi:hypothetical protein